jgi:hypothetical protein
MTLVLFAGPGFSNVSAAFDGPQPALCLTASGWAGRAHSLRIYPTAAGPPAAAAWAGATVAAARAGAGGAAACGRVALGAGEHGVQAAGFAPAAAGGGGINITYK